LVCKGLKRCSPGPFGIGMIDLVTLVTHLQCDSTAQAGTHELDQIEHPLVFNDPSEESILPLPGIRQVSMSKK
jgi:hypothetical protein